MKRVVRQAIIFLSLLLVVSVVRLPYGSYRDSLLPKFRSEAAKVQITGVDAQDIYVSFPATFTVTGLSAYPTLSVALNRNLPPTKFPLPLFIDEIRGKLRLLPLLWLNGSLTGAATLYGGQLDFTATRGIFGNAIDTTVEAKELKLETHPAFQAVGARGSIDLGIHARTAAEVRTAADVERAVLQLSLSGGELSRASGLIPLVKLPVVNNIELFARADFARSRLALTEAKLDSSLGSVRGSGTLNVTSNGRNASGGLKFQIKLTPEGVATIGGFLALGAGISPERPPAEWLVEVVFQPNAPARASIRTGT